MTLTNVRSQKKIPSKSRKGKKIKFYIEPILDSLTYIERKEMLRKLESETGYSYQFIYNIRKASHESTLNIPSDKVILIAKTLGISIDLLLFNN
jgi:hypothetical protein